MVRRLKSELPPDDLGRRRFPLRTLEALEAPYGAAERQAHADLVAYGKLRQGGAEDATEDYATQFVLNLLKSGGAGPGVRGQDAGRLDWVRSRSERGGLGRFAKTFSPS